MKIKLDLKELHDHLNLADQGYASLRKDCEMCSLGHKLIIAE